MFRKILIANRGEIAVRILRTCRDLGISPVAIFSEADRGALHVRLADEAYCVGKAPSVESYLRADRIIDVARGTDCEAVHPGYGFLAENASFASACRDAGFIFIGPSAEAIDVMGDKIRSRDRVRAAGVEGVPGSDAAVGSAEEVRVLGEELGYPLLIKASAGGGGKGMRIVEGAGEVPSAFRDARREAEASFGDPTLFAERYVRRPRHIEIQLLADQYGEMVHLGERECSIQRRHQKLVEESPSPLVDASLRERLGQAAVAVARSVDYTNAGTVEFLVEEGESGEAPSFYFLEMNTRLQVEHPVTELVTGFDLVAEQLRVAAGEELGFRQDDVKLEGAALECRVYAEDPEHGFLPSPGRIHLLEEPGGLGIRNDSGVYEGFTIPEEYDPLISKLVAYGRDRNEALNRMARAIREYRVGGVRTTLPFFARLIRHPEFVAGRLHTHFIEQWDLASGEGAMEEDVGFLAAAALNAFLDAAESRFEERETRSRWKDQGRGDWR